ncbi:PREDICTED: GATA transcription factor 18 [Camelina sativa]|uniref:GATA transcription factor 18 n=1 Tax=Camelina sativa TaxID=90675 RepID=A0ABM0TDT4_CAMSA|nr:PREDICTED: GATA transcription factor 18 [Camelina sativa]
MMQTPYTTSTQGQYCHSCGMFHHHSQSCCYNNNNSSNAGSYSMVFSMPNGGVFEQTGEDYHHSSSAVDCTLSLGTPSTRLCEEDEKRRRSTSSGASSCISNFWDLLHTKNNNSKTTPFSNVPPFSTNKPTRGCSGGGGGGDSLLSRRCANCDTTSTPLWRNGPRGPKSLCNACGIRFKKEERRTTAASGNTVVGAAPVQNDQYGHHNSGYNNYHAATGNNNTNGTPWAHHHSTQRVPCNYPANEIRFMDDYNGGVGNNGESDGAHGGVPCLSWRLNVADRASLVHDFTR